MNHHFICEEVLKIKNLVCIVTLMLIANVTFSAMDFESEAVGAWSGNGLDWSTTNPGAQISTTYAHSGTKSLTETRDGDSALTRWDIAAGNNVVSMWVLIDDDSSQGPALELDFFNSSIIIMGALILNSGDYSTPGAPGITLYNHVLIAELTAREWYEVILEFDFDTQKVTATVKDGVGAIVGSNTNNFLNDASDLAYMKTYSSTTDSPVVYMDDFEVQTGYTKVELDDTLQMQNQSGQQIFPGQGYRYGPSVIINPDGSIDMWLAMSCFEPDVWDVICYRNSSDGGLTWTTDQEVLRPTKTADSKDFYSCCDPGIIKFGGYYYLGYTSTINTAGTQNQVFIARSLIPTGPYEKWNGSGWGGNPEPLIEYNGDSSFFGYGEPSFVLYNNKLYIYYTDSTATNKTCLAICHNPFEENWPANLDYRGDVITKYGHEDSCDVKYVPLLSRFIAVNTYNRMISPNATISVWQSEDGISWMRAPFRGSRVQEGCHNAGISGNDIGHLNLDDENFIAYAYWPEGSDYTGQPFGWGNWPTYLNYIEINLVEKGKPVQIEVSSIAGDLWSWSGPKLIDEFDNTVWSSCMYDTIPGSEWCSIDLGKVFSLEAIGLKPRLFGECFPVDFSIYSSWDNSNWTLRKQVINYPKPLDANIQVIAFDSIVNARYYKIETTLPSTDAYGNHYFQLDEVCSILEEVAPTGSVVINDGAAYTTSQYVTLSTLATDNSGVVSQMRFSHDNLNWTSWENYSTSKNWVLLTGVGLKNVYAQYKDTNGNISACYYDSIYFDNVAPTGSIIVDYGNEVTFYETVDLMLSAYDDSSEPLEMCFYTNIWSDWISYSTSASVTIPTSSYGTKYIYVRFKDAAGNYSTYSDSIIYTIKGDFDGNLDVNIQDLLFLSQRWLFSCDQDCCDATDINADGVINFEDWAIITQNW